MSAPRYDGDAYDDDADDFDPSARFLLHEPFYWDPTDDFAPHGNDAGWDAFAVLKEWWRSDPSHRPALSVVDELLAELEHDLDRPPANSVSSVSSVMFNDFHQAVVGVAFGHIKLYGTCPKWLVARAIESLEAIETDTDSHYPEYRFRSQQAQRFAEMRHRLMEIDDSN